MPSQALSHLRVAILGSGACFTETRRSSHGLVFMRHSQTMLAATVNCLLASSKHCRQLGKPHTLPGLGEAGGAGTAVAVVGVLQHGPAKQLLPKGCQTGFPTPP